jgi:uncharacterized integral membrane protein (TIGR00698 family)
MLFLRENFKGLLLCISICAISYIIQFIEINIFNEKIFDVLIISLIIGIIVKNTPFNIPQIFSKNDKAPKFVSKQLLEFAVILLGFKVNFSLIKESGSSLILLAIISVITCMILVFILCKYIFNLDKSISILVATGNSICGNSAVAAMASVIKSAPNHVAIAISFSAVIGLIQVLLLPLIPVFTNITDFQYGVIAGLSVYAVPQVVAASFVVSTEAGLIATQVKLLRVLMLGPVIIAVNFLTKSNDKSISKFQNLSTYVPWFVVGFIIASIIGSLNLLPNALIDYISSLSKILFAISMAGIGLTVNIKDLKGSALKVSLAVIFATLLMIIIGIIGINLFNFQ